MLWRIQLIRATVAIAAAVGTWHTSTAQEPQLAQPNEIIVGTVPPVPTPPTASSNAYPGGDYLQQLHIAGGVGGMVSSQGQVCDTDWGCGGSPYRTGPGCGDDWRVGPRWRIVLDGLMIEREETNLSDLAGAIGTTLGASEHYENFGHNVGVRLLGTAYWPQCKNYELALGYIGVDEWNASVVLPAVSVPPMPGPPPLVGVEERRTLNYQSSLHALELNWQALNDISWKPYAGIRFFRLDEQVNDMTRQYTTVPLGVGETAVTTTTLDAAEVENNLIGFQLGLRRDLWNVSRKLYIQGFANSGVYCNLINRVDTVVATTTTTEVLEDDPDTDDIDETGQVQTLQQSTGNLVKTERTELAFVSEASLTLVWKINNCCALRSGYEVMVINGVELADDAFLDTVGTRDMLFHGCFAGFEYRR